MSDEETRHHSADASLSLLDELARKRREVAQDRADAPRPTFLNRIERTEVRYVFRPSDLPLEQLNSELFVQLMKDNYHTKLSDLDISPLLAKMPKERLLSLGDNEALDLLLRLSPTRRFAFDGGRFPLKFDFVPIHRISIDFESIQILVAGLSEVAETVAQETMQLIWSAAGSSRSWDKISSSRKVISYGTETLVTLPFPPEVLVNPHLMSFFDEQFLAGEQFIARAADLSTRHNFAPSPDLTGVIRFDNLVFRVKTFDKKTGRQDDQKIVFTVTAADDYGTGVIRVTSTMKSDDHIEFVAKLLDSFK